MITLWGEALALYQVVAYLRGWPRLTALVTTRWWAAAICYGFLLAAAAHLLLELEATRQERELRRALREVRYV